MSAFIVSSTTLNVVVYAVLNNTRTTDTPNIIGQRLLNMNHAATSARYPTNPTDPTDTYVHRLIIPPARIQQYKSLQCFLYQCSEGDVPADPLYLQLSELLNDLAQAIIADLPTYRSAIWDLPEPTHTTDIIRIIP